jgi:ectoine hydroxylase-related dioxygenase (phytanoyl-CoA dioxygenase family)
VTFRGNSQLTAQRPLVRVDEEQISAFQRDGVVCVRQLFSPAEIALLSQGIEANLARPSPRAKVASAATDPGRFIEDFCCWQENEAYRRFIFESAIGEVGGRLMRSTTARLYHDHMLTKEPRTQQRTPWHQDQPYYNIEGRMNVSFWIPVDPVTRASTLEFVAGSHLGPWLMPRTFLDAQTKWFPEGSLADLPERTPRLGDLARLPGPREQSSGRRADGARALSDAVACPMIRQAPPCWR